MKTAKHIKDLQDFTGHAALYELSEPVEYDDGEKTTRHVIVSAAVAPFSGPETYIFPAYKNGKIKDWGELSGSYKGGLDHAEALEGAGFSIATTPAP